MTAGPPTEARVWRSQIWTIAKSEVRRTLFSRRSFAVYLLVAMPLALMLLRAIFMPDTLRVNAPDATTEFAEVFHFFLLRFVVFFANAMIFVRLFRGEILEKSLHYTLLAPIRRDVLVLGKYLGGVLSAVLLLVPATTLTYLLVYLPHGRAGLSLMSSAAGVSSLLAYLVIVVLACFAYGALFMLAGLLDLPRLGDVDSVPAGPPQVAELRPLPGVLRTGSGEPRRLRPARAAGRGVGRAARSAGSLGDPRFPRLTCRPTPRGHVFGGVRRRGS